VNESNPSLEVGKLSAKLEADLVKLMGLKLQT